MNEKETMNSVPSNDSRSESETKTEIEAKTKAETEEISSEERNRQTDYEKMEEELKEREEDRKKRDERVKKDIDDMRKNSLEKKQLEKKEKQLGKTSGNKKDIIEQGALRDKNDLFYKNRMSWIREKQKARKIIRRVHGVSSQGKIDYLDALKKFSRHKTGGSTIRIKDVKEFENRVKHGFNGELLHKMEKKGEINREELDKTIGKRAIIRKLTDAMIGDDRSHG